MFKSNVNASNISEQNVPRSAYAFGQTQQQAELIQAYHVTTPDDDHAFVGWFYKENGIIHGPFKDEVSALIAIGVPEKYLTMADV